jgi:hypothetical protein
MHMELLEKTTRPIESADRFTGDVRVSMLIEGKKPSHLRVGEVRLLNMKIDPRQDSVRHRRFQGIGKASPTCSPAAARTLV